MCHALTENTLQMAEVRLLTSGHPVCRLVLMQGQWTGTSVIRVTPRTELMDKHEAWIIQSSSFFSPLIKTESGAANDLNECSWMPQMSCRNIQPGGCQPWTGRRKWAGGALSRQTKGQKHLSVKPGHCSHLSAWETRQLPYTLSPSLNESFKVKKKKKRVSYGGICLNVGF